MYLNRKFYNVVDITYSIATYFTVDFAMKVLWKSEKEVIKLQLWDIAGTNFDCLCLYKFIYFFQVLLNMIEF